MIVLRGIEPFECRDLGRNGLRENARPVELVDVPPRNPALIGIGREDGRAVPWSDIRPLAIELCRREDYWTDENDVGLRNELLIEATIGPSLSLSVRAAIQAGSVWKAFHLVSHSPIESQASM